MSKYWEIEEGKVDSAGFLQALWRHFPQATTFYVEGTSVAGDVMDFYLHKEEGDYLPDKANALSSVAEVPLPLFGQLCGWALCARPEAR